MQEQIYPGTFSKGIPAVESGHGGFLDNTRTRSLSHDDADDTPSHDVKFERSHVFCLKDKVLLLIRHPAHIAAKLFDDVVR